MPSNPDVRKERYKKRRAQVLLERQEWYESLDPELKERMKEQKTLMTWIVEGRRGKKMPKIPKKTANIIDNPIIVTFE